MSKLAQLKEFYKKHERAVTAGALLSGFILDNFTLRRIDLLFENLLLIFYLLIAGGTIVFINLYESGQIIHRFGAWLRLVAPIILQFAMGALFSAFFIFYFRSATFSTSWIFLLFLLLLMIGNEIWRKEFLKMPFQIIFFFIALFSYLIFALPITLGAVNVYIFVASGILSLILLHLFIRLLHKINGPAYEKSRTAIILSVLFTYIFINTLYFANIIPPIPLSMKEAALGYEISRQTGEYHLTREDKPWYSSLWFNRTIHLPKNQGLVFFSSIFAPTNINTKVAHVWQIRQNDEWITSARIPYTIHGGADEGFRGYSIKTNLSPGLWRVSVQTESGQIIGRKKFRIEEVNTPPPTETVVY